MVESIYGQGFAYVHEVEERRQKVVKLGQEKTTGETTSRQLGLNKIQVPSHVPSFALL
jgi:hypothetical protein